jgi:predicted  nucleic acid-binding Zn-ribbon protein
VSIEAHIATLEKLVVADAEIKELTDHIRRERADIEQVRSEVNALGERLEADQKSIAEMDRMRQDLLQELRQIDKQLERSRERLQRSRNERESNAAERELDELRKLQRDRDEELRKLAALTDQARMTIQENEQRREQLAAKLEGSLEGATRTITELEQRLEECRRGRSGIAADLPKLTFRRYESMHERGKVPVAKTSDGTCLGCYVQLPPMLFHKMLSRIQFEECPNCHRIIYYEPPEAREGEPQARGDAPS